MARVEDDRNRIEYLGLEDDDGRSARDASDPSSSSAAGSGGAAGHASAGGSTLKSSRNRALASGKELLISAELPIGPANSKYA